VVTKIRASLFVFFCLLALGGSVSASMVLPLGLDRLHGDAKVVFLGECLSNSVEMDAQSGRVVTYTTFEVLETYKGTVGSSYTIKQIGGNLPGANLNVRMPGVPQFEVGKRYVVFLPPASKLGFSSPVGLGQGMFSLKTDATGAQMVSNGRDIGDLTESMAPNKIPSRVADKLRTMSDRSLPANTRARAEMHLDDLRTLLRGMK